MKFVNELSVDAPAAELFAFLSDVERVAPCLPGARLDGRNGDDYRGSMKVKVGPITGVYEGTLRFLELDEQGRRAVLSARANEASGQGDSEFARNIEQQLADGSGEAPSAVPEPTREDRSLDALGLIAGPLVKRAVPVLVPALIGFGYGYLLGRLRELTR
jgi:carbon monoxide dehydrogenase subunit G